MAPIIELDRTLPSEGAVYALAIHGPNSHQRGLPGFMHIVFPRPDCSDYSARIDLFKKYPEILVEFGVAELTGIPAAYIRRHGKAESD
jgi:hypothetical protein